MKLKKTAALLLAAALALGTTACASEAVRYIATVEGESIPSGIYLNYLMDAYNEAFTEVPDATLDNILKQQIDGTPASDWMTNRADEKLRNYSAVEKQFTEQGLPLDDATTAILEQNAQYQWQMYSALYDNNGISYDSYYKAVLNSYKENELFLAQYGPEGKNPVPDADIQAAFAADYFRARYITASLVDPSTAEPYSEEDKQKATEKLSTVLAASGADGAGFLDAILTSEKEQAVAEGREESTVHTHDETTHVYYMEKSNYPDAIVQQIEAMNVGELKLLTSDTTAYLIQRLDVAEKPEDMENYRSALLYKLKGDAFQEQEATWAAALNIQYVEESKKLYKPSKLKFD